MRELEEENPESITTGNMVGPGFHSLYASEEKFILQKNDTTASQQRRKRTKF